MTYTPNIGVGDALSLFNTKQPVRTAGRIASREAIKYGGSFIPDLYNNGRFTSLGGGVTGGLIGAAGDALMGGDPLKGAVRGATSGYIGSLASNTAINSGASAAGAGIAGSAAGSMAGLGASMLLDGEKGIGPGMQNMAVSTMGSAIASGVGAGTYAGPIGAALGAAVGLIRSSKKAPRMDGSFLSEDQLFKYDPKTKRFEAGRITGFESSQVPEKYWDKFAEVGNIRLKHVADNLNGKEFSTSNKDFGRNVNLILSSQIRKMPRVNNDLEPWLKGSINGDFFDHDQMIRDINSLTTKGAYINKYGGIENPALYDGTDEGGDMPPPEYWDYLENPDKYNSTSEDSYAYNFDYDSGE